VLPSQALFHKCYFTVTTVPVVVALPRISTSSLIYLKKGKVPLWGPSALQPIGLLYSDPEGVPSFISASEGRNNVEEI
jgi:hypothetical protein